MTTFYKPYEEPDYPYIWFDDYATGNEGWVLRYGTGLSEREEVLDETDPRNVDDALLEAAAYLGIAKDEINVHEPSCVIE
jgi:hypothetical protein